MSERIGVGIVGLSAKRGWAATAHLPALRAIDGFEVVALSASSEESAAASAAKHEVPLSFGDSREMVARPEVDLVVVTVIVPAHLELVSAAIEAGISAYVVDGLRADRLKPILDAAIARFHLFQRMRAELASMRTALEERKIIDRAKAILMKARGIDEEAAYALLRKTAMNRNRKIVEIAQSLLTAADLLGDDS